MTRFSAACLTAAAAWIVVETLGGLAFLAAGLRLWQYEIFPVAWAITSPVVWVLAAVLIVPCCHVFDRAITFRLPRRRWLVSRLGFLMVIGPVLELLLNDYVFRALAGRPLYVYTFLDTFNGSGSLLSPFYYATLIVHAPVSDRLLPPLAVLAEPASEPGVSDALAGQPG